jgi:hypothetical protein
MTLNPLLFSQAIQPKRGLTRPCGANPEDINKVIHRNSEFLTNALSNQALAAHIEEMHEHGTTPLAQKRGARPS